MSSPWIEALQRVLEHEGTDWRAWSIALARILPSVLLVPAFGLRGVAASTRLGLGLAMAFAVVPAVRPLASPPGPGPEVLAELLVGFRIAVGAAAALWAATMAGGLIDNLRSGGERAALPNIDGPATPSGAVLGMLVAIAFLRGGGVERVARAATRDPAALASPLAHAVVDLHAAIGIAVAAAVPLVVASIVVEVSGALMLRAASPASLHAVVAPLRSVALLGLAAILLDRIVEFLVLYAARVPP